MKKYFRVLLGILVLSFLAMFFVSFAFLNVFYEFDLISAESLLLFSLVFSFLSTVACVLIALILIRAEKKTKLGNWLSCNSAKLTLTYLLLIVFLLSIKAELVLAIQDIKEILSLSWTIFGISMAIFLIWNVIATDYLEKRKPNKPTSNFPLKKWLYINEKGNFYNDATMLLSNINLLTINLFFLVVATGYVYIYHREASIFSQSITFFVLLLCTNSIVGLFLDILKPFNEKKKQMLQETKVTALDIDLQNKIDKESEKTLTAIEAIEKLPNIDADVKTKLISGIIKNFVDMFDETVNVFKEEGGK